MAKFQNSEHKYDTERINSHEIQRNAKINLWYDNTVRRYGADMNSRQKQIYRIHAGRIYNATRNGFFVFIS